MEFDGGSVVEIISGALFRKHAVEAIFASIVTILLYDWMLTLPQEIKFMWRASWNWTKVLYLLTRYIPFASMAFMARNQFAYAATPDSCKRALQAACWLSVVGMDLAEIVLAVRTYAVWNKDKRVGISLALLLGLCQIPNGIFIQKFMQEIDLIQNPYPEIYRGCVAIRATKIIYVNWVLFSIVDGVVLVLMVISATKSYHRHVSDLLNVIYMDGIRFYLYLFCVTLVNVVITLVLPIDFVGVGSCIEIVLHSNLACRLMIGLREAGQSFTHKTEALELSGLPEHNTAEFAHTGEQILSGESSWVDLEGCAGPSKV